jgi:hypothetical protein
MNLRFPNYETADIAARSRHSVRRNILRRRNEGRRTKDTNKLRKRETEEDWRKEITIEIGKKRRKKA